MKLRLTERRRRLTSKLKYMNWRRDNLFKKGKGRRCSTQEICESGMKLCFSNGLACDMLQLAPSTSRSSDICYIFFIYHIYTYIYIHVMMCFLNVAIYYLSYLSFTYIHVCCCCRNMYVMSSIINKNSNNNQ